LGGGGGLWRTTINADWELFFLADNVDYNSLKHEIKVHTTRDQATAIAIPGHQDAALEKFENGLYNELCGQHARIDLFVTSKADEISRRLGEFGSLKRKEEKKKKGGGDHNCGLTCWLTTID
jgi:hypothetical protein